MLSKKSKITTICLITPGHISTDPRLMKEVNALLESGFKVHVIFTQYMDYLLKDDDLLLSKYPQLTYDALRWVKKNNKYRISHGIVQKFFKGVAKVFTNKTTIHKFILNRHYLWQYKKAVEAKADLYIAHNSGALAIAADAAKKNDVPFGFDAEDFHRGENLLITERKSLIYIEDHYLPMANHLTAASELIAEAYEKIYHKKFTTVLNVFPKQELSIKAAIGSRPLELFWFSQTIGNNRGIENIINALNDLQGDFKLHLLGDVSYEYKNHINALIKFDPRYLVWHKPVNQDNLFKICKRYDIGLATETGFCINNNIALSNKIFTYIQCGLAVIASDTLAQTKLYMSYPDMGDLYQNDNIRSLTKIIHDYQLFPERLIKAKQYCSLLGNTHFNWEIEKIKFINALNNII
ncbi:hypothetical protein QF042_004479 [Pedobacter sp. W3I1]|uniref:hypothetical protein n=1 Tax=Pedobacter sp. W3I1 TaxID=3042291 RepID=UPI00277ED34C|nr:hypothetical protein [Pedobacter sp. W3I1]MDQ0640914.1 hypothetical protein [Pedobacter sp. W3I1]